MDRLLKDFPHLIPMPMQKLLKIDQNVLNHQAIASSEAVMFMTIVRAG